MSAPSDPPGGAMAAGPREWDADLYHRTSDFQLGLGLEVLERLPLEGDETVLDAGCGTGRVTAALAERLPRGRVIAVDGSEDMVRKARTLLPDHVSVLRADLVELSLDEPVDAILSTAVFHWIPDHDRLFARLHSVLRPGGRLVAQCGGEGNVSVVRDALRAVTEELRFAPYLSGWEGPWRFPSPDDAARRLANAGFVDLDCRLEPRSVTPDDPHDYLRTVTLGQHLDLLPENLKDPLVDAILDRLPDPPTIDYVRLNIDATRRP